MTTTTNEIGYVYFAKLRTTHQWQIGFTQNVHKKMVQLKILDADIELFRVLKGDRKIQKIAYDFFQDHTYQGNWFLLSPSQVDRFCYMISQKPSDVIRHINLKFAACIFRGCYKIRLALKKIYTVRKANNHYIGVKKTEVCNQLCLFLDSLQYFEEDSIKNLQSKMKRLVTGLWMVSTDEERKKLMVQIDKMEKIITLLLQQENKKYICFDNDPIIQIELVFVAQKHKIIKEQN